MTLMARSVSPGGLRRLSPLLPLTAALVLLVTGLAIAVQGERSYHAQKAEELGTQARILAATVSAALSFGDRRAAQEYVAALSANPELEQVVITDTAGRIFARYARQDGLALPEAQPTPRFDGDTIVVSSPVAVRGQSLGRVVLQSQTVTLWQRITRYGVILLLAAMGALVVLVLGIGQAALAYANRQLMQANASLTAEMEERRRAEAGLLQAQKMEAVGQLTGGIAHDFNNVLAAIIGSLDLLQARLAEPRQRRLVETAMHSALRGARLTKQLLVFARRQQLTPAPVDLNATVQTAASMLRRMLGSSVHIELALCEGQAVALVDPTQLELAILNLAINSRDAMPGGGTITIATGALDLTRPQAAAADLQAGRYVRLSVSDTGEGMSEAVRERAFEPFYTTKEAAKGSGLGLSQVYGLACQSGGTARIDSKPGTGTRVDIILPASDATVVEERVEMPMVTACGHGTVLVVDDQEDVLVTLAEQLEALGYRPITASDPGAALLLLGKESIDLAIIDYVMPGVERGELAHTLDSAYPQLPYILVTGYAETENTGGTFGDHPVLRKPFRINQLEEKLREATSCAAGTRSLSRHG
jgi:signal transduction histidine kinase/CheY-like chemotaxis protein